MRIFALWSDSNQAYAHVRGRIVCFSSKENAVAWREQMLGGDEEWWPADMEQPHKVLYPETHQEEHRYWLWEDGEYHDAEADKPLRSMMSAEEEELEERIEAMQEFFGEDEDEPKLDYWDDEFWEQ